MRRRVNVGQKFDARIDLVREKTRAKLASVAVAVLAVLLLGSSVYGFFEGNFEKLESVWDSGVVPVSIIIGFYFGQGHPKN